MAICLPPCLSPCSPFALRSPAPSTMLFFTWAILRLRESPIGRYACLKRIPCTYIRLQTPSTHEKTKQKRRRFADWQSIYFEVGPRVFPCGQNPTTTTIHLFSLCLGDHSTLDTWLGGILSRGAPPGSLGPVNHAPPGAGPPVLRENRRERAIFLPGVPALGRQQALRQGKGGDRDIDSERGAGGEKGRGGEREGRRERERQSNREREITRRG